MSPDGEHKGDRKMSRRVWILACALSTMGWSAIGAAEREPSAAPVRWAKAGPGGAPGFMRHVQPLLAKMGCSGRACHGSFQGQGGFRLSLFGSEPKMDYEALDKDPKGSRVDLKEPENSLTLLKATKELSHKGGKRFEKDSWQYRL